MTHPSDPERTKELSRLWEADVVPVEDEATLEARRARVVPTIGGVIGRAAEKRKRALRVKRFATAFAVAAGALGSVGVLAATALRHREKPVAARAVPKSGVRAVSGVVTLMHEAHESVVKRAALSVGDSVSTAADATAEVALTDLVVARVGGSSEVDVVLPRSAFHRLRLDRGRIDAKVDDRPSSTPKLIVETPDVEVVVTGTIFEVAVTRPDPSAPSVTHVEVTKGRIVVRRGGMEVASVGAGEAWTSAPPLPRVEAAPAPPVASTETMRPRAVPATVSPPPATKTLPSAGELAEVQVGTLAEENALFQSAAAARRSGDDAAAAERLGQLLTRYPSSLLSGEARVERMRALARAGRAREAALEARRYLLDHPDGFAREEAKRLVMPGQTTE